MAGRSRPIGSPGTWRWSTAPTATSTRCRSGIAHVRTWTFVANRPDWLARSGALAGRDASGRGHAVRRPARTSREPLRRPAHQRPDAAPERERDDGSRDHRRRRRHRRGPACRPPPRLPLRAGPGAEGDEAKTLRNAAEKALAGEIEARAERFAAAADSVARPVERRHDPLDRRSGGEARAGRQAVRAAASASSPTSS